MTPDMLPASVVACAICGGAVDDIVMLVGSGVGLTGLAIGFEIAFTKASRVFGWQFAEDSATSESESDVPTGADPPSQTRR